MGSISILPNAKGRSAFVTGAAGGIGRAVVDMLLDSEVSVIATGRRPLSIDDERVLKLTLDVTDEVAVRSAFAETGKKFGRLDYVIHMAGMVGDGRLDETSLADWKTVLDTNLTSAFLILREAYPLMRKNGGTVVLCGSSNGTNGGSYLSGPAYASSKAGLNNLTRYCAKEWAPDQIRVHCLSPGPVDTPMLDRLDEKQHASLLSALPLGSYATARQCAAAVLFLCSEHAASMTGTTTNISSGLVLD